MNVLECRYILPTGQTCRCAALRNQRFCRHHAPRPLFAGPPPLPKRQQYSRLSRWRRLGQAATWLDPAEIPVEILGILESLLGQNAEPISNLAAGRYLRALLRRLGHLPFTLPGRSQDEAAGPPDDRPADPAFRPAPELVRLVSPQSRPFPLPAFSSTDPAPAAQHTQAAAVHAALEEAFPNGRPQPGQKIDPETIRHLSRAFIRHGIVPPEVSPKGRQ
ncbi:MAG TPA: hypothetical protein VHZ09_16525 [Acidobacteriaceae bacterium]|jgi:hypothetical protein|nr:hypothetical protein [Acidobacteriaceae bacterium]